MNFAPADQILEIAAWFLALIEFILALYILLLNSRHTANRHVGALLLFMTINNIALSLLVGADDVTEAALPTLILAAMAATANPGMLLVAVVLLKPQWLRGRWRGIWWPVYGLVFLPILLTLVDLGLGTRLWYTGLNAEAYAGGFAQMSEYLAGGLSVPLRALNFRVISVITIIPLLYIAFRDKEVSPLTRRLAMMLLGAQIAAVVIQLGFRGLLVSGESTLATSTILVLTYAYAVFQQMISEQRLQRGKLQTRLTALILVVTIPVLVAVVVFVSTRAGTLMEQAIVQQPGAELLGALQQFRRVSWAVLVVGVMLILSLAWLTIRQALRPIGTLTETAIAVAGGDLTRTAPVESEDEIGALARSFNQITEQLRDLIGSLEQRVADRTRELERQSGYLETAAEVAQAATSVLNVDDLLRVTINLICERFGYYHGGIFLLDETGRWAEYRAGIGDVGRILLERGFRLEIGSGSMIGWCVAHAQPSVTQNTSQDSMRLDDPLLPQTRSEAALPLIAREQVIGAISVQSDGFDAFDPLTVSTLQTLANQIAVAIDNARLLTSTQESLNAAQRAYGELSYQAWSELLRTHTDWGYRYAHQSLTPAKDNWRPEMLRAAQTGQSVQSDDAEESTLAIPLKVRNQVIGALRFRKDEAWTTEETTLLETLTNQLELAIESAQLYQDTQHRAARERLTGEVTARMRETLDIETVLETAAIEMREALGLDEAEVWVSAAQSLRTYASAELHAAKPDDSQSD